MKVYFNKLKNKNIYYISFLLIVIGVVLIRGCNWTDEITVKSSVIIVDTILQKKLEKKVDSLTNLVDVSQDIDSLELLLKKKNIYIERMERNKFTEKIESKKSGFTFNDIDPEAIKLLLSLNSNSQRKKPKTIIKPESLSIEKTIILDNFPEPEIPKETVENYDLYLDSVISFKSNNFYTLANLDSFPEPEIPKEISEINDSSLIIKYNLNQTLSKKEAKKIKRKIKKNKRTFWKRLFGQNKLDSLSNI